MNLKAEPGAVWAENLRLLGRETLFPLGRNVSERGEGN